VRRRFIRPDFARGTQQNIRQFALAGLDNCALNPHFGKVRFGRQHLLIKGPGLGKA
jgi:hypothetical protein